jgi:putative component of membrane protein insertase Oxa1/YidC/SpoIIIJ protein YidD
MRRTMQRCVLGWGLLIAVAPPGLAAEAQPATTTTTQPAKTKPAKRGAAAAFGPFDAGAARPVTRQGARGRARRAHPAVGARDHIPGAGPPPPALREDPYVPEQGTASINVVGGGLSANPLYLASLFYANFLTRTDGPRCQHLPTCSRFANQAVARHGLLGIPLGLDRLIQPPFSSALRPLPEIDHLGTLRHFDPLENYEFWHPERFTGLPLPTAEEPLALTLQTTTSTTTATTTTTTAATTTTATTTTTDAAPVPASPSSTPPAEPAP